MRVVDMNDDEFKTFVHNAQLPLSADKICSGEILVRTPDYLMGPLKIVEFKQQYDVVVASDNFNYYCLENGNDIEISDLESIFMPEQYYETITGNIFLDGFLSAAYQDSDGLLKIDITDNLFGLTDYITNALDTAGISYHKIINCITIDSEEVVYSVFENSGPCMPPKYILGFLASRLMKISICKNSNCRYARYFFVIDQIDDTIPPGFFTINYKGRLEFYTLFGSFEPFSALIDRVEEDNEKTDEFKPGIKHIDLGIEDKILPKLIHLLFSYSGYSPMVKSENPMILSILTEPMSDERQTVAVIPDLKQESIQDTDCVVSLSENRVLLHKVTDGKICPGFDLLFDNQFIFSDMLINYFDYIFRKL